MVQDIKIADSVFIKFMEDKNEFEEFQLERNQSLFENEVDYNLSESGVHPLKISEILSREEQTKF